MPTTTDNTYAAARAEFDRKYRSENFEKYDHGEYYVAHGLGQLRGLHPDAEWRSRVGGLVRRRDR